MVETRRLSVLAREVQPRLRLPDTPMLLAVSGGADSAAMAGLVARNGRFARAVHVNHGFAESARLEEAARSVARTLGMEIEVRITDVGTGPNLEARARSGRYRQFLAALGGTERLLTAHTLDDVAETVIMHLARGSGMDGLSGIAESRPPFHRPLLRVRRAETRELASLMGLAWIDDPANEVDAILRNRVRSVVMPALEETFGRDPSSAMARSALLAQEERAALDAIVDAIPLGRAPESIGAALAEVPTDPALAGRLIRKLWSEFGFEHPLGHDAVGRVLAVARGETRSAQIGNGVRATRSEGSIRLSRPKPAGPAEMQLPKPGEVSFGGFRFVSHHSGREFGFPASPWATVVKPEAAVKLRWAVAGDQLGERRVDDMLSAAAVDQNKRRRWPVLEADGKVVWVVGIGRAGWDQTDATGYLSVVAVEEELWKTSIR